MTRLVAHYTLVRLLPQADAGEFVNIGIVLVCPALRRFNFQLLGSSKRVTQFFHEFTASLFRQVRADLHDELAYFQNHIAQGVLEPQAVLSELCRPRESLIRYAEPRTLFIQSPEDGLARLMARFIQRDANQIERNREEVLVRQVRHALTGLRLNTVFTEQPVGTAQFHVRLPFVHRREGVALAAIKPLNLAQDEAQKIYDHADPWIQRFKRLNRLAPLQMLIPASRPPADDTRRQQARQDVENELNALPGVEVVSVDEAPPILAFAQRYAVVEPLRHGHAQAELPLH